MERGVVFYFCFLDCVKYAEAVLTADVQEKRRKKKQHWYKTNWCSLLHRIKLQQKITIVTQKLKTKTNLKLIYRILVFLRL